MRKYLEQLDPDIREQVERRLGDLCEHGFHFCQSCQRVTLRSEQSPFGCVRCGSPRVKWHPPIPGWSSRLDCKSSLTASTPKV